MVRHLVKPERYNRRKIWIMKTTGQKMYWDPMLKKNNAYDKRFDRPYAVEVKTD